MLGYFKIRVRLFKNIRAVNIELKVNECYFYVIFMARFVKKS